MFMQNLKPSGQQMMQSSGLPHAYNPFYGYQLQNLGSVSPWSQAIQNLSQGDQQFYLYVRPGQVGVVPLLLNMQLSADELNQDANEKQEEHAEIWGPANPDVSNSVYQAFQKDTVVSASMVYKNQVILFVGDQFYVYDMDMNFVSGPHHTQNRFCVPAAWDYQVDAAMYYEPEQAWYLFKSYQQAKINSDGSCATGYPKSMYTGWGMPFYWDRLDAAVYIPQYKAHYFVNGNEYIQSPTSNVQLMTKRAPNVGNWPLPSSWSDGLVSSMFYNGSNQKVYSFSGSSFARGDYYSGSADEGYPQDIGQVLHINPPA